MLSGVERGALIMDACRSHTSPAVVADAWGKGMPVILIPGGCTSWVQYVDTHFAAAYRSPHFKEYQPFANTGMTASTKRRLLARIVATTCLPRNVAAAFAELGYTNPAAARIRNIPEFVFVAEPRADDEVANDGVAMDERVRQAANEGAAQPQPPEAHRAVKRPGRPTRADTLSANGHPSLMRWMPPRPAPQ